MASSPAYGDGEDLADESIPELALQAPIHIGLLSGVETTRLLHMESIPCNGGYFSRVFVKTPPSTDLAYHKSGSLMSKYVVCE